MTYANDDDIKPAYVMLPRRALFEFFGEVALPPWYEADGTKIGGSIDCAPIAQRVIDWIEMHDVSGGAGPLGPTKVHEAAESAEPAESTVEWVEQAEPRFHFE